MSNHPSGGFDTGLCLLQDCIWSLVGVRDDDGFLWYCRTEGHGSEGQDGENCDLHVCDGLLTIEGDEKGLRYVSE